MADIFQHMDMASSGEDAIEKLRQQFYDMILMDIDMPGLNGIDAASWIRRGHQQQQEQQQQQLAFVLTQNRYIPIVAVTTNMSMEWKKAYLKVGMVG
ncbi:CheY-like superfamily [Halteromyces radiatus]|uniref:CheY-like superfamily n=1 Tax=Halteromyces radiatus TaxID=101107 RepID=UPI0022210E5F|nr:CheY-like superfamily [Halteromyces radiatus]KAI8081593.1 CheY-like superfamily [Halteromyces radiatus]